ncbi:hypothetical protein MASR2M15_00690 [Anaerolineales bacterium]
MSNTETRGVSLVDIPLLRRFGNKGIILNTELKLTRDAFDGVSVSDILFPRNWHTYVSRIDDHQAVGQFQYRPDENNAYLTYLAPEDESKIVQQLWLEVLDTLATEAGSRGAQHLIAEVDPNSLLFEVMRQAGYAVYSRQSIWYEPPKEKNTVSSLTLEDANQFDVNDIQNLMAHITPKILQQIIMPVLDMRGLIYCKDKRIEGFIGYTEGKKGVLIRPFLHPNVMPMATEILHSAMALIHQRNKVPLYVGFHAYQSWLTPSIKDLHLIEWADQAIMVKHLAAGVKQPEFATVNVKRASEAAFNLNK